MPIYEYRCSDCERKVSIFFRSIASAADPHCPRCGGTNLERLVSRVNVIHGSGRDSGWEADMGGMEDFGEDDDWGADPYGDPYGGGLGGDPYGFGDDADPREIARWTRQMSAQMGEPLDADLDRALGDIERGADPDEVLGQLEESEPSDWGDGDA